MSRSHQLGQNAAQEEQEAGHDGQGPVFHVEAVQDQDQERDAVVCARNRIKTGLNAKGKEGYAKRRV